MLTTDSKRCKHYMERDGMLGIHILYIMYRWKGRPSSSMKTHYNQQETSRSSYTYLLCFCTPHITRTGVMPVLYSVCARISATMHCKTCISSMYFATVNWRLFTAKVLFTEKLCFTTTGITNIHNEHEWPDENRHAIQSHHQQWQFFISLWAAILGDCHIGPHILLAQISGLNFLQTYLWPIRRYVLQFASLLWFQHNHDSPGYIHEVCQWLFENLPGCEAPVSCSACPCDLIPLKFSVGIFENQGLDQYSHYYRESMMFNSTICRWNKQYVLNLWMPECFFFMQFCCPWIWRQFQVSHV